jgi:hypothetical protein
MFGKKRLLISLALVAVAMTTTAWAQALMGTATITILAVQPKISVFTPPLQITPGSKGTSSINGTITVSNVHFNFTVIRVSLVDLGGLYRSMKSFTVTLLNQTGNTVWGLLTLNEPLVEFDYNSTATTINTLPPRTFVISFIVSWQAEQNTEPTIIYGISAEVVQTYDYKTA